MNNEHPPKILSQREVCRRTSLSRTTLWRLTNSKGADRFPRAVTLSANRVGYREAEVEAWIAARPRRG